MNTQDIKEYILSQGSESIPVCGGRFEGGIYLQQHPDEISEVLNYLLTQNKKYTSLLEVGSAAGGNSKVFKDILNIDELYIVDDNNHPRHIHRSNTLKGISYKEYIGNSQSVEAFNWVKDQNIKFDIIYIDADHSYSGVKNDLINYLPFLHKEGIIIFHDTLCCEGIVRLISQINQFNLKEVFSSKYKLGISLFKLIAN